MTISARPQQVARGLSKGASPLKIRAGNYDASAALWGQIFAALEDGRSAKIITGRGGR